MRKLSFKFPVGIFTKISMFFCPAMLFGMILGFGLKTDYPNFPKHITSQSVYTNYEPPMMGIIPVDVVSTMIGQVNQDRIMSDLRKLTGVEQVCLDHGCYTITNRYTGSEGLQWAKEYIYEELTSLGYSVEIQDWSRSGYNDQNLIIRKQGTIYSEDEIYFLAHIDGINNSPTADDNASGVVSLLELARIITNYSFSKTIVLLFSTGEEESQLGVRSYIDQLTAEELSAILYVVNVDMVGYDANNDGIMEFFNGSQPTGFVQSLIDIISAYQINLKPQIYSDCGWGDEGPFREKGITAAVQIQDYHGEKNPYYHKVGDNVTHINPDYLFESVKATTALAGHKAVPINLIRIYHLPLIWVFK